MTQKTTSNELNVSFVHRRIGHHANHSGYNTVFEHMGLERAHSKWMERLIKLLPQNLRWRLHHLRPQPVGDDGLIPELLALPKTRSKKPGICHFIYGEDTYFYTPIWKRDAQKMIATFHYPPQRLVERVSVPAVKSLDAVVLMASNQVHFFKQFLPDEKIFVVQHHVDTDFFVPADKPEEGHDKFRIISLGGILRDMDMLFNVVKGLTDALGENNIQFDFLIPKAQREQFKSFKNVTLHTRISDEELRELYQNASLGFMPLQDCTANNAVLEMMACGKAIACSHVGGISDYIDEEGAFMFDQHSQSERLVEQLIALLKDAEKRQQMGRYNREKAVSNFSIKATQKKLNDVYQRVAKQ